MNQFKQVSRLIYINYVLAKHGIDNVVFSAPIFYPIRFISYLNPWNWFRKTTVPRGQAVRESLEELGPIFVKFGQILSTRRDFLPKDIADELAKLQDNVPPFSEELARKIIETTFNQEIDDIFASFENKPLASASIAQVHSAILKKNGESVVVKVQRPNIEKTIKQDIALFYYIAKLMETFWQRGRRIKPTKIVREFEKTILNELDLIREAANATQLRRQFIHSDALYIPRIEWDYVARNVLVMEKINGTPISHIAELKAKQVDLKVLAENGVRVFFTQVFEHCYFHADMHPGNLFVNTNNPKNPQYIAVDFGIMGSLSDEDQHYLAENLLAFLKRDYHRITKLHIESGWVPSDTRPDEFEADIRAVTEPIFAKPLKDISFGELLMRLFQTASRFHMEIQPQLILLQKTLLNIEGVSRDIYPNLDLWLTAQPILEKWLRQKMGPKAIIKKFIKNTPRWASKLADSPDLFFKGLENLQHLPRTPVKKARNPKTKLPFLYGIGTALLLSAGIQFVFFAPLTTTQLSLAWLQTATAIIAFGFGKKQR